MNLNRLDIAAIIAAVVAIASGAVWLGMLHGTVNTLIMDRDKIKEERESTLNEINAEKEKVLAELAKAQQKLNRLKSQRDKAPATQVTEEIVKAQQALSDLQNRIASAEKTFNALNQALQVTKEEIAKAQQEFNNGINSQRDKALAGIQSAKQQAISSAEERLKALFEKLMAEAQAKIKSICCSEIKTVQPKPSDRYTDNGDGTVTDNRTGLIWLKNANCFGGQSWNEAEEVVKKLADGRCGLSDGSRGDMWHLPTRGELEVMVDKRYKGPALSNAAGTGQWTDGDAFSGVSMNPYWSSSIIVDIIGYDIWYVDFNVGNADKSNDKTDLYYVWPVRGWDDEKETN